MEKDIRPEDWAIGAAHHLQVEAQKVAQLTNPVLMGKEQLLFQDIASKGALVIETLTRPQKLGRDRCIYIFELDDGADEKEVLSAAINAKRNSAYRLPQINSGSSRTLYVGSSVATGKRREALRTRLSQHILATSPKTYALSLAAWATSLKGGMIISAWQYPAQNEEDDLRQPVLAVEDWLSSQRQPLLGQRGTKN